MGCALDLGNFSAANVTNKSCKCLLPGVAFDNARAGDDISHELDPPVGVLRRAEPQVREAFGKVELEGKENKGEDGQASHRTQTELKV